MYIDPDTLEVIEREYADDKIIQLLVEALKKAQESESHVQDI